MADARDLYLDLLARCLLDAVYENEAGAQRPTQRAPRLLRAAAALVSVNVLGRDVQVRGQLADFDARQRWKGPVWPRRAHTMIGEAGLANIRHCVEDVLARDVPGDLIETGVWRGGAAIFMRGVLKAREVTDRRVWVADSFQGLPPPDPAVAQDRGSIAHVFEELRVSRQQVEENFRRYDLLDEQVCFLEGWFADTLPEAPIERLAVMRLDGDMYGSTMDALRALYPRLSIGGHVIIDDYGALQECRAAVEDYRRELAIEDPLHSFDAIGRWWQRSR